MLVNLKRKHLPELSLLFSEGSTCEVMSCGCDTLMYASATTASFRTVEAESCRALFNSATAMVVFFSSGIISAMLSIPTKPKQDDTQSGVVL